MRVRCRFHLSGGCVRRGRVHGLFGMRLATLVPTPLVSSITFRVERPRSHLGFAVRCFAYGSAVSWRGPLHRSFEDAVADHDRTHHRPRGGLPVPGCDTPDGARCCFPVYDTDDDPVVVMSTTSGILVLELLGFTSTDTSRREDQHLGAPTSRQPTSSQPTSSQPTSRQQSSSQRTSSEPTSSRLTDCRCAGESFEGRVAMARALTSPSPERDSDGVHAPGPGPLRQLTGGTDRWEPPRRLTERLEQLADLAAVARQHHAQVTWNDPYR